MAAQSEDSQPSFSGYSILVYLIQMLSHLLNGYLTAFFVFTGIVLNIFSIYIFLRCERGGTPAIQYYLVTLTMWQTALLANAFLLYSLPHLLFGHLVSTGTYVHIYPYVYTFANTTHTGSVWIVLTLTIDRYLALCQPLKHRAIGKKSRVKRLMVIVSLLAVLFSLPRFFEVEVITFTNQQNEINIGIDRTSLFDNKIYWTVYHIILAMLFVTLCPCLLLFALTLRISLALRTAIAKRKSLCAPNAEVDVRSKKCHSARVNSKKEHKSNIMLVLVIAKFLVSDILPTVIDVLEHLVGQQAFMRSPLASLFVDVSNFLIVLNCSSNFWVFIIWGKRFRKSCRQLVLSTACGISIYRLANLGSDPDVSYCAPSSFTTIQNTTKIYGSDGRSIRHKQEKNENEKSNERTIVVLPVEKTRTKSSSDDDKTPGWDFEKATQLEQLEKQRLIPPQ
ncbi:unnamed protein product [Auanema sp. JU1783]|nr:unnamed protein product [Auanema sp. JU1783]